MRRSLSAIALIRAADSYWDLAREQHELEGKSRRTRRKEKKRTCETGKTARTTRDV